jgi:hypothetical protein
MNAIAQFSGFYSTTEYFYYFGVELDSANTDTGKIFLYWCPKFKDFSLSLQTRNKIRFKDRTTFLKDKEDFEAWLKTQNFNTEVKERS